MRRCPSTQEPRHILFVDQKGGEARGYLHTKYAQVYPKPRKTHTGDDADLWCEGYGETIVALVFTQLIIFREIWRFKCSTIKIRRCEERLQMLLYWISRPSFEACALKFGRRYRTS